MFWKQLLCGLAVVLLAVCPCVGCVLSEGEEEVVGRGTVGLVSCAVQSGGKTYFRILIESKPVLVFGL